MCRFSTLTLLHWFVLFYLYRCFSSYLPPPITPRPLHTYRLFLWADAVAAWRCTTTPSVATVLCSRPLPFNARMQTATGAFWCRCWAGRPGRAAYTLARRGPRTHTAHHLPLPCTAPSFSFWIPFLCAHTLYLPFLALYSVQNFLPCCHWTLQHTF